MATRLAPARPARALRPDAAPAPGDRRHLRVVPPGYRSARTRRKRARLLVVLTGAAIAAALFGVVAFHVVLTQNQLDIQHLRAGVDAASVKQQQLRLQVAELESPERVVDAAQKLGMVPPATVHYLSPDGTPAAQSQLPTPKAASAPAPTRAPTYAAKPATAKTAPSVRTTVPSSKATTKPTTKAATPTTTPGRPAR
jgi:cell division protein FtsL